MIKIGITGHRNLVDIVSVQNDIKSSFLYFKERNEKIIAKSALASGADMLFAEEAIRQNIPLEVILPFELEEYKKDFQPQDYPRLEVLIAKSMYLHVETPGSILTKEERVQAYVKAGQRIVEESDIILAVWNGKEGLGIGGTSDMVGYAQQLNKELHLLLYDRSDENDASDPVKHVDNLFLQYDREAIYFKKKKFEPAWRTGIIAGLMAVTSFAVSKAFVFDHTTTFLLLLIEFVCIIVSFVSLAIFAKRWRSKFLQNRRTAEYLRSISWYEKAGVPLPKSSVLQHMPAVEILDLERKLAAQLTAIRNIPNAQRIAWCLAEDQIRYHDGTRIALFRRSLGRLENWLHWLKIVFFIVTPLNFLFEVLVYVQLIDEYQFDILLRFLLLFALLIPPFYAALEGVKYFSEWKRDIGISEKMIYDLKKCKEGILQADDEATLLQETKKLRDVLELENNDWTVRFYEKEVGAKV